MDALSQSPGARDKTLVCESLQSHFWWLLTRVIDSDAIRGTSSPGTMVVGLDKNTVDTGVPEHCQDWSNWLCSRHFQRYCFQDNSYPHWYSDKLDLSIRQKRCVSIFPPSLYSSNVICVWERERERERVSGTLPPVTPHECKDTKKAIEGIKVLVIEPGWNLEHWTTTV